MAELTAASEAIRRSYTTLEEFLYEVTRQARTLIGAHQSVTSLTLGASIEQWITAVDLSDRYAAWRAYEVQPKGDGIYAVVLETNRPMRLTQRELEAHPRWRAFGSEANHHPPMRGWLAAPLVARDGRNLGLIQLSDKDAGEFTEQDEAVLVELATLAASAIENADMQTGGGGASRTHTHAGQAP
jgi:GAF domain-containing protein